MKFITTFFAKLIKPTAPKPMGRWNIDYCNVKMDKKIDLSNEDHCGPCGQYAITKLEVQPKDLKIYTEHNKHIKP